MQTRGVSDAEHKVPVPLSVRAYWKRQPGPPRQAFRIDSLAEPVLPMRYRPGQRNTATLVVTIGDTCFGHNFHFNLSRAEVTIRIQTYTFDAAGRAALKADTAMVIHTEPGKFDSDGIARIPVDVDSAFRALETVVSKGTGDVQRRYSDCCVNRNALTARITVSSGGKKLPEVATENVLHVLLQKMVLFLPGVCGSEIHVDRKGDGSEEKAFLRWSGEHIPFASQPFEWLSCDMDGNPSIQTGRDEVVSGRATKLDLLRTFAGETIYAVEDQPAVTSPRGCPVLYRLTEGTKQDPGRERVPHFFVQAWPYDWRVKLEETIGHLAGRANDRFDESTAPPYRTPPSLREVIGAAKRTHPFLDDRIAVSGHSTGGVILRGLLTEPVSQQYIDLAFFVDVPFWGAPKAYYIFLTGALITNKWLDPVSPNIMRRLAPNVPIVYYLAPTERYSSGQDRAHAVAVSNGEPVYRREEQKVGEEIIRPLVAAVREGDERDLEQYLSSQPLASMETVPPPPPKREYPNGLDPWRDELEKCAAAFHRALAAPPLISYARCRAFWSQLPMDRRNTHGPVVIAHNRALRPDKDEGYRDTRINYEFVDGDTTVPVHSQQGEFATVAPDRLRRIGQPPNYEDAPEHMQAPSHPQVWDDTIEDIFEAISHLRDA